MSHRIPRAPFWFSNSKLHRQSICRSAAKSLRDRAVCTPRPIAVYGYTQNEQQEIRRQQEQQPEEWKREEEFCRAQVERRTQEFREEERRHKVSQSEVIERQISQRRQQARRSEEERHSRQNLRLGGSRLQLAGGWAPKNAT